MCHDPRELLCVTYKDKHVTAHNILHNSPDWVLTKESHSRPRSYTENFSQICASTQRKKSMLSVSLILGKLLILCGMMVFYTSYYKITLEVLFAN